MMPNGPEISVHLEPYGAVYIEVPKVACTSLKVVFARLQGVDLTASDGNPHVVDFPSLKPSPKLRADGERFYPGLFTFGFVRNPWDRLVSCYRDKIGGAVEGFTSFSLRPGVADCLAAYDVFVPGMAFADFVRAVAEIPDEDADEHFRSQFTFLSNAAGIAVDFIGRFENFDADFQHVAATIGLPLNIEVPRLQAARPVVSYADFYTPRTRAIVASRYGTDIQRFGYSFS